MANLWFSLFVIFCFHNVFANICPNPDDESVREYKSCDECIRCGFQWCSQKNTGKRHCFDHENDDTCESSEEIAMIESNQKPGTVINPIKVERTVRPKAPDSVTMEYYSTAKQNVTFSVYNTSQTKHIGLNIVEHDCVKSKCYFILETKPVNNFCLLTGSVYEFFYVSVRINDTEAFIKYHVPCACECSKNVYKKSPKCSGNGDLSCGYCRCYDGWGGDDCSVDQCEPSRGDISVNRCEDENKGQCYGNGVCNRCNECSCFEDREGSQYFDKDRFCADICIQSTHSCLHNASEDECSKVPLKLHLYNESIALKKDDNNRKIWIHCKDTIENCPVEWYAMKEEGDEIHVMVTKYCNGTQQLGLEAVGSQVPLIVGLPLLLCVVATVAGVVLWKYITSPKAESPLTGHGYENIEPEECIGENPLYKPPTSCYKNPIYGKS